MAKGDKTGWGILAQKSWEASYPLGDGWLVTDARYFPVLYRYKKYATEDLSPHGDEEVVKLRVTIEEI